MASSGEPIGDPVDNGAGAEEGNAELLVSEFPPPPYYYRNAASVPLKPPEIPEDALSRGTRRAAAAAARARAEAERKRLEEAGVDTVDKTDAILGGVAPAEEEEEGDVVAVFGEIVEDPLLVEPFDRCDDPTVIRDEVKRLNRQVLKGFAQLVQDLVHRPMENKKTRDELTHHIFMMLQECNKFREHQSRELLIELLETQLAERKKLIKELQGEIAQADKLLLQGVTENVTKDVEMKYS